MVKKLEYGYDEGDLIKNPQKYQRSKFFGNEFLTSYKESRNKILKKIENHQIKNEVIIDANQIELELEKILNDETINLEELLFIILNLKNLNNKNLKINNLIDVFLKKFEIKKKLVEKYNSNFEEINDEKYNLKNYIYLSNLFMIRYEETKNLKFLNAQLKINDTICSQLKQYENVDLSKLFITLKNEIKFVEKLFLEKGLD